MLSKFVKISSLYNTKNTESTESTNISKKEYVTDEIEISCSDDESNDKYNEKEIQEAMKEAYENVMKELSSQIRETDDCWNELIENLEKKQNDNSDSDTNDEQQSISNEENVENSENSENEHIFRRRKRRRVDDEFNNIASSEECNDSYENSEVEVEVKVEVEDNVKNKSLDDRYEEGVSMCLKAVMMFLLSVYIFSFYAMFLK